MLTTSNLLTAFMLGGWLAATPAAFAANATYSMQGEYVRGSLNVGDIRMAGSVPVTSNLRTFKPKPRQWGQRTVSQNRFGGRDYGNLNQ
ncbi:MAG: hypothetical protein EPN97_06365 [Alphaproteobacteria bacterium]|nr:MAG: hypothetical protein EPN97_06365 [Alphaproteobacteria bacterium]